MIKQCEICGKEFEAEFENKNKYCSDECRRVAHIEAVQRFKENAKMKDKSVPKCGRSECRFWQINKRNGCKILCDIYADDSKCKFFKGN